MDRRLIGAVVVLVALALVVGLGALIVADEPEEEEADEVAAPAPAPRPERFVSERTPLPPPPGVEVPPPPRERPREAELTPDDRKAMNYAVDGVLKAARAECLHPWLASIGASDTSEFVFDAVLYDGRMSDVGIRSLHHPLPPDVVACVADKAWLSEWPEWELPGELRLQRSFQVTPR